MSLADGEPISGKLVWKVDWPMRWAYEGVAFEPAGEDHHAPTGSFTVGSTLVREVFGAQAPNSAVYSFVSLAGLGGKLSGSAGGAPTPETALTVLEPAIVRWLYIRRLPSQGFAIDLSAKGVQKLYDEWDRFVAGAAAPDATRGGRGDVPARRADLGGRRRGHASAASRSGCSRRRPTSRRATASRSRGSSPSTSTSRRRRPTTCSPSSSRACRARSPTSSCWRPSSARRCARPSTTRPGRARRRHARGRERRWPPRWATRLDARRPDGARLRDPEGHARPAARRVAEPRAQGRPAHVLQGALPALVRVGHRPAPADAHALDRPRAHARAARTGSSERAAHYATSLRTSRSGA